MQYMNYEYLIRKHSKEFTVITYSEGEYSPSRDYVEGKEIKATLTGAIVAHRQSKIFRSEGAITEQDRALYMLEPLDKALLGAKLIDEGNEYRIQSELQNAAFTGVYAYGLKYVSVFGGGAE